MDRVDRFASLERLDHLGESVSGRVDQHHLGARSNTGDDRLIALDTGVDEHDLSSRAGRHALGNALQLPPLPPTPPSSRQWPASSECDYKRLTFIQISPKQ